MRTRYVVVIVFAVTFALVVGVGSYVAISNHGNYAPNDARYMTQSAVNALDTQPSYVSVVNASNRIYVNGSSTLMVELSPSMGGMKNAPQEYFVILGMTNPTIVAKQAITINFVIVNTDNMEHNFELTTQGPPYSYMTGMGYYGGYGENNSYYGGMMGNLGMYYGNASSSGYSMMYSSFLPPYTGNGHYPYENSTFTTSTAGNYWYICAYPGHAEEGMQGEFIVS